MCAAGFVFKDPLISLPTNLLTIYSGAAKELFTISEKNADCRWENAYNSTGVGLITAFGTKYLPPLTESSAECLKTLLADFQADPLAGVALIIEPKYDKMTAPVVLNMIEHLPSSWKVQIITSIAVIERLKVIFKTEASVGKILFTDLGQDDIPFKGSNGHHMLAYNWIVFSPWLWSRAIHENILLVQTDTWICANGTDGILEWMKYDYVGAPWRHTPRGGIRVGNGGFSFRKRSAMKRAISYFHDNNITEAEVFRGRNEDEMFGDVIHNHLKGLIPAPNVALRFAVETQFYPKPFGIHKYWKYQPHNLCEVLKSWCNNPQWNG